MNRNKITVNEWKSAMSLADEIGRRVFDENAETIAELVAATGLTYQGVTRAAKARVQNGEWEQVWKKVRGRPVPAYRRRSKNPR